MLQPGTVILTGKYRIEELIGKGAFAEVYRATHLELNIPRAVKILRKNGTGIESTTFNDYRDRYRHEFQIAARLDHPNVIKVYDLGEEEGALYAILEYAAGGSLKDLIAQQGRLPVDRAERILLECTAGLEALHDQLGVIHRDIKPSNILLHADQHAIVADLGLAQSGGGQSSRRDALGSQAGRHPGTPDYSSPEHDNWQPLTPTSDVFSLGCVAFEMLTGQVWKTVMHKIARVRDLRAEVPEGLDAIVMRMLCETPGLRVTDAANPKKRYVTMSAVATAVRAEISGQGKTKRESQSDSRITTIIRATVAAALLAFSFWAAATFLPSVFPLAPASVPATAVANATFTPPNAATLTLALPTIPPTRTALPTLTIPLPTLTPTRLPSATIILPPPTQARVLPQGFCLLRSGTLSFRAVDPSKAQGFNLDTPVYNVCQEARTLNTTEIQLNCSDVFPQQVPTGYPKSDSYTENWNIISGIRVARSKATPPKGTLIRNTTIDYRGKTYPARLFQSSEKRVLSDPRYTEQCSYTSHFHPESDVTWRYEVHCDLYFTGDEQGVHYENVRTSYYDGTVALAESNLITPGASCSADSLVFPTAVPTPLPSPTPRDVIDPKRQEKAESSGAQGSNEPTTRSSSPPPNPGSGIRLYPMSVP